VDTGIKGKVALVTGAGRGLGRAACEALDREGAVVVAVSRGRSGLDELRDCLQRSAGHTYIQLDLEHDDATKQLIAQLTESGMSPDIIVNNVGGVVGSINPLDTSVTWRRLFRLNLEIATEINEAFIPTMQKRQWGRICHVSSIAALENQGTPAYCAANAALTAYVRSLARFVASDNVILTAVLPGATFTVGGYWDELERIDPDRLQAYVSDRMAIKRLGSADEIAEAIVFLCSELASFCVGTCMLIDGGQGRVFFPLSE